MTHAFLKTLLGYFAKKVLHRYKPDVIGITGSVGKTSTKDAITLALQFHFRVQGSEKNYNTEIGVPLTILGAGHPGRSIFGWIGVFLRALRLLLTHDVQYPSILALEMGADKPGDIDYLTKLAPCKIGVLTAISPVHLEHFGSIERLAEEKKIMYRHLSHKGVAILNAGDSAVYDAVEKIKARVVLYGLDPDADVRVSTIEHPLRFHEGSQDYGGIRCVIQRGDESVSASFPRIFRMEHLSSVLAAVAVASEYHIPLSAIVDTLHYYQAPPGRSRLLEGIKHTLLIDDTYNSSPKAAQAALDVLADFQIEEHARRIAVLGDMKELGTHSAAYHEELGRYTASKEIDLLVTVGPEAKRIAHAAHDAGMDEEHIEAFDIAAEAGKYMQEKLKRGDVVLVKGSQDIRLERVVEEIMARPDQAEQLLVRQESYWKRK